MELNINFKRELEPLINSSEALADWFEKNQEMMAYFEMTHPGCLHFENTNANYDEKRVHENFLNHYDDSSLLIGRVQNDDIIKIRKK